MSLKLRIEQNFQNTSVRANKMRTQREPGYFEIYLFYLDKEGVIIT